MLRLNIPTESYWVECPYGVRLLCRPLTSALNHAAIARAARRLRDMGKDAPDDADLSAGARQSEALFALGDILIEAWEGVGDAEGTAPAPVTPENIRKLLSLPEMDRAFNSGISQPLVLLAAEGNA